MKNKILSIVLAFIFVFACYPTVNAKTDNLYFDEANTLLVGLGFEDASSKANEIISREAFIKLLVNNSFYEGIELDDLAMMGIYADSNFYFLPENQICLKDALIICVKVLTLGADDITDYDRLTIAWDLDLNDGISLELDKSLTYSDAYILLYNYLNADISVYNGRFAIGNTSILADKHHIDVIEGFVDKAGRFAIDSKPLETGKISINGKIYTSEKYGEELFGRNIVAYIRDSKTLIAASLSPDCEITQIYSSDCPEFKNNRYIFFDENSKEDSVTVSQTADMFYNGSEFNFDSMLAVPESGKITVIDNSVYADGADVVIIDSAKTVKAESVDRSAETVYSQGQSFKFDDHTVIIDDTGKVRDISKINVGDILSLYVNQDGIVSKCVKITKTVSGNLDSVGNGFITLNGEKYKVADSVVTQIKNHLGKSISAYIDEYAEIVYFTTEKVTNLNVGIMKAAKLFEKGLSSSLRIKIYTKSGNDEEFNFAENVRVNGQLSKTYSETYRAIPKIGSNIKQSLVAYELNDKNEIVAIEFPSDKIMDVDGDSRLYKTSHDSLSAMSHVTYNKWREDFGEGVFITPETTVFITPRQNSDGKIVDDLIFYTATECQLLTTGTAYHNHTSTGYGFDPESKISSVVVLEYEASGSAGGVLPPLAYMYLVGDVMQSTDQSGDTVEAIRIYGKSDPEGLLIYGDSVNYFTSRNIEPGDLIRVDYVTQTKKVNLVEIVYKNGADTLESGAYIYSGSGGGKAKECDIRLCRAYKKWSEVLDLVYLNQDMENVLDSDIKPVKVYGYSIFRYNKEKGKVEELTVDDLRTYEISGEECSNVVIHDVNLGPNTMVIID